MTQSILFADSARGIYIPQHFAESIDPTQWCHIDSEDLSTLRAGPDSEFYWDAWDSVLNNAESVDGGTLHQDGDLWIIYVDAARDAINEHCEQQREYEEAHVDAGNNYAHMPRESWCTESTRRLIAQLHETELPIDSRWTQLESDVVADCALDAFKMESRHQFHSGAGAITLESYPIGEIEIDLSGIDVDGVALDFVRESCDAYINGTLAYVTSDITWCAVLDIEQFNAEIAARFD